MYSAASSCISFPLFQVQHVGGRYVFFTWARRYVFGKRFKTHRQHFTSSPITNTLNTVCVCVTVTPLPWPKINHLVALLILLLWFPLHPHTINTFPPPFLSWHHLCEKTYLCTCAHMCHTYHRLTIVTEKFATAMYWNFHFISPFQ